jgi:hypothetical protein
VTSTGCFQPVEERTVLGVFFAAAGVLDGVAEPGRCLVGDGDRIDGPAEHGAEVAAVRMVNGSRCRDASSATGCAGVVPRAAARAASVQKSLGVSRIRMAAVAVFGGCRGGG